MQARIEMGSAGLKPGLHMMAVEWGFVQCRCGFVEIGVDQEVPGLRPGQLGAWGLYRFRRRITQSYRGFHKTLDKTTIQIIREYSIYCQTTK